MVFLKQMESTKRIAWLKIFGQDHSCPLGKKTGIQIRLCAYIKAQRKMSSFVKRQPASAPYDLGVDTDNDKELVFRSSVVV